MGVKEERRGEEYEIDVEKSLKVTGEGRLWLDP